jgi:uncharacterized protein (TIGR03437 family)
MLVRLSALLFLSAFAFAAPAPALTAPTLVYSTYLRQGFTPNTIATDSSGNIYIAGNVLIDPAAFQTTILVIKLNPQGTQYLYARYLGGSVYDSANAIAVDGAGNAYIAGQTGSPDFPVTANGSLGTSSTGTASDRRSFVTKLDPTGSVVFSDLLGGSAASNAQAVAVTPAGEVVVSGLVQSTGFQATTGAYTVPNSNNHPYLLKLDATGTKLVFSSTGIGGSALALDSSGNIYIAGTTNQLDYPTTPGVYQATFPAFMTCFFPCQLSYQGSNQYVTKVDPAGSKLIYSTSVSGTGNTTNAGLAVDKDGNAYVTGFAGSGYPYSVTPPSSSSSPGINVSVNALPFLSKLDPAGQNLLFSVPIGGAGVQVDSAGSLYVGGRVGSYPGASGTYSVTANLPVLAGVPPQCLPGGLFIRNSAYVAQVGAASGDLVSTQWIGGSSVNPSAVTLFGSTLWIAGPTAAPDVLITPNALAPDFGPPGYGLNLGFGAHLGGVDFSAAQPPAGTPEIGCVLDASDLSPAGAPTRYQLLSLLGSGLGPATGVSAPDNATTTLAGVTVTFGSLPAILLYVSSTQINLAVPLVIYNQSSAVMRVIVNGTSSQPRQFPLSYGNPHLFMNGQATYDATANPNRTFVPLTLNEDGSMNSPANPAQQGSIVSVFVNGIAPDPEVTTSPLQLYATGGWMVEKVALMTPFIFRVDAKVPSVGNFETLPVGSGCTMSQCEVALMLFMTAASPPVPTLAESFSSAGKGHGMVPLHNMAMSRPRRRRATS